MLAIKLNYASTERSSPPLLFVSQCSGGILQIDFSGQTEMLPALAAQMSTPGAKLEVRVSQLGVATAVARSLRIAFCVVSVASQSKVMRLA
jgi:hypothetical protein